MKKRPVRSKTNRSFFMGFDSSERYSIEMLFKLLSREEAVIFKIHNIMILSDKLS